MFGLTRSSSNMTTYLGLNKFMLDYFSTWGRLIYRFCPEKCSWHVSPRPLPLLQKRQPPKMILCALSLSPCPEQMGLGQTMLPASFSRTAMKVEHNQYLLHIFGYNYDIFSQFMILGRRKSVISMLTETSSNKTPIP